MWHRLLLVWLVCAQADLARGETFLDQERERANIWNWTWTGIFAAGVTASTVQLAIEDDLDKRINHKVALAKGMLALTTAVIFPLKIPNDLQEAAENELSGRSLWAHLQGFAVNLGASLYLGLRHENWGFAAFSGIGGMAITEIRIFTQPYRAVGEAAKVNVTVGPMWIEDGQGIALVGAF